MTSELRSEWKEPRIMPIQLRPDLIIYIQDLPHDLTKTEAEKLVKIIRAMVKP